MSYSFNVRAATKAEAKEKVAAEFAKVVASQPAHATEARQVLTAADAFVDLLPEDAEKQVFVSMNGYLSGVWSVAGTVERLSHASVSIAAGLVAPESSQS